MDLWINGEKIKLTLETEKTLENILASLRRELLQDTHQITNLIVNGTAYPVDEIPAMNANSIQKIELQTISTQQMLLDSFIEISNYLLRVGDFLVKHNDWTEINEVEKNNFKEGLLWLQEMYDIVERQMPLNLSQNNGNNHNEQTMSASMRHIIENMLPQLAQPQEMESLLSILDQHISIVNQKIEVIRASHLSDQDVLERLHQFTEKIPNIKKNLSAVSPLLQDGKDSEAYQNVQAAMNNMQLYLTILPTLEQSGLAQNIVLFGEEEASWQQVNEQIMEYLHLLAEAMEDNDTVTMTDICDYELPDALDMIPQAMKQLRSQHN